MNPTLVDLISLLSDKISKIKFTKRSEFLNQPWEHQVYHKSDWESKNFDSPKGLAVMSRPLLNRGSLVRLYIRRSFAGLKNIIHDYSGSHN